MMISELKIRFLDYTQYEKERQPKTIQTYDEGLKAVIDRIGDLDPEKITYDHIIQIKKSVIEEGKSQWWSRVMINALKSFLFFCQERLDLITIDPTKIKLPSKPRKREVIFLTNEEVKKLLDAIGKKDIHDIRNQALVRTLLSTGMRISEALSVNRDDIDFKNESAKIIGKNGKERTVFFNPDTLKWIKKYLKIRKDNCEALFLSHCKEKRLSRERVTTLFIKWREFANLIKKVTAHICRHTFCTNLVLNGAPLPDVQTLAGHVKLQTTVDYYVGVDRSRIREIHRKFLNYKN